MRGLRAFILQNVQGSVVETEKKVLLPITQLGKEETLIILLSAWDRSRDSTQKRNLSKHMWRTSHSVSKFQISFGNWFWHLIVENRSFVLEFYQQRPVFALKNHPRPQRPKRPMKANKGQHSPKLQISLLLSLFNVKSSTNVNTILKKCVFKKLDIFIFIT